MRRDTDEHIVAFDHQLCQHRRNVDPTKLWMALVTSSREGLDVLCARRRETQNRQWQRTTQKEILQSLPSVEVDHSKYSNLSVDVTGTLVRCRLTDTLS